MRRVQYKEVLRGAAETSGRIFSVLSTDDAELLRGFIGRRLREAWESNFWPELMVVEERTISSKTIPYEETGKSDLGEVQRITDADPRTTYSLTDYEFNLTASGFNIPGYTSDATSLWVTYRKQAPELTGSNWAEGSYISGAQVYHTTQGDFYDQDGAVNTSMEPPDSPWVRVDFPYIFKSFCERAAASDLLLLDEKSDLAIAQKQQADDALSVEMAKLRLQGHHNNIKIKTHRGA